MSELASDSHSHPRQIFSVPVIQGVCETIAFLRGGNRGRKNKQFLLSNLWSSVTCSKKLIKNVTRNLGRSCSSRILEIATCTPHNMAVFKILFFLLDNYIIF